MDAAGPSNRPTWFTFTVAGLWVVYFCAMPRVASEFQNLFWEIAARARVSLSPLTLFILGVPTLAWVLVGVLGAGLIVGKSYALGPKAARIVDGAVLGALVLIVATSVLCLCVPLRTLRLSF